MRRAFYVILIIALAGAGFGGTWWALRSPQFALYQIGKSIHHHDAPLFLAYVDIDRILRTQKDELVSLVLPKEKVKNANRVVSNILAALLPQVSQMVKDRVVQIISNPERDNLPNSYVLVLAAQVSTENGTAEVLLQDTQHPEEKLRFLMQPHPLDGHWQVVHLNPEDLKNLFNKHAFKDP